MDRDLIIDVGANNGDDTAHYLARGFRVVTVEANPELVKGLEARFADAIRDGRLVIEGVGVTDRSGEATFYVSRANSEWSAFDYGTASRGGVADAVTAPSATMTDLFRRHGVPYYLKVDIEGNDGLCLEALDSDDLPVFVSVEAHRLEYLATLWAKGYRHFRVVDQTRHNLSPLPPAGKSARQLALRTTLDLAQRVRARLGLVETRFPAGSSGPVPDEGQDGWEELEPVAYDWLHVRMGEPRRGTLNPQGWFDFQARRPT